MNEDTQVPDSSTSDRAIGEEGRNGKLGKTAGRADGGKSVMHTIDPKMMMAWAEVLAFGAKKYHQRNFMVAPGMAWSRVYESLNRHLWQFWAGEWLDEESGLPHLAHVLCNIQFLWTYHEHPQYQASDDRPSTVEYAGGRYADWEENLKQVVELQNAPQPKYAVVDILGGLARSPGRARDGTPGHYGQHRGMKCHVIASTAQSQAALSNATVRNADDTVKDEVKRGKARLVPAMVAGVEENPANLVLKEGEAYARTVTIPLKG